MLREMNLFAILISVRIPQSLALFLGFALLTSSSVCRAASLSISQPKLPVNALPLPTMPQATDYSCGPATLLSVLVYWQAYEGNEEDLYPILGTTRKDGTHPVALTEGAKLLGLDATLRTGMTLQDLRNALRLGQTVILDIQAWKDSDGPIVDWKDVWNEGHYVALIGITAVRLKLLVASFV